TEGNDLAVLKGGQALLNSHRFDFIEVEAGVYPENDVHIYFLEFIKFLEPLGYKIFGFYEQMHEWKHRYPYLRRTNLLFVSEELSSNYHHEKLAGAVRN